MPKCQCRCLACGLDFEAQATMQEKEEGKIVCPGCQSSNIKQKFSLVNFIKNVFCGAEGKCCCSDNDNCCEKGSDEKDNEDKDRKSGCCCCDCKD